MRKIKKNCEFSVHLPDATWNKNNHFPDLLFYSLPSSLRKVVGYEYDYDKNKSAFLIRRISNSCTQPWRRSHYLYLSHSESEPSIVGFLSFFLYLFSNPLYKKMDFEGFCLLWTKLYVCLPQWSLSIMVSAICGRLWSDTGMYMSCKCFTLLLHWLPVESCQLKLLVKRWLPINYLHFAFIIKW